VSLKRALGTAPKNSEGWSSYFYTGKVGLEVKGRSEHFDVSNSLEVELHVGAITAIQISEITSN
jgi:hypothetical protein